MERYKEVNGQHPQRLDDVFMTHPMAEQALQHLDASVVSYNVESAAGYLLRLPGIDGLSGTNDDKVLTGTTGWAFVENTRRERDSVKTLGDNSG